jgi:hypothetical protein
MLMRVVKVACRHTSAPACAQHVVWSEMYRSAKRNRGQGTAEEAPLP